LRIHQAHADWRTAATSGDSGRNLAIKSLVSGCAWSGNGAALTIQGADPPAAIHGAVTEHIQFSERRGRGGPTKNLPTEKK
jgi:hypothetical protein